MFRDQEQSWAISEPSLMGPCLTLKSTHVESLNPVREAMKQMKVELGLIAT